MLKQVSAKVLVKLLFAVENGKTSEIEGCLESHAHLKRAHALFLANERNV